MLIEGLLIAFAGVVAGVANTIAGGGSLLTIPMLTFVGIPATVANATLRPALVAQNVAALMGYRRSGVLSSGFPRRATFWFIACAIPGALAGAWFAAWRIDDRDLERVLAVVLAFCALIAARGRGARELDPSRFHFTVAALAFGVIGAYGGFIQAGVGFLIIGVLVATTGWSMTVINAVKVAVVLGYTIPAAALFGLGGKIHWPAAALLILGHSIGGLLGSRVVTRADDGLLRRIYVFTILVFALKMAAG